MSENAKEQKGPTAVQVWTMRAIIVAAFGLVFYGTLREFSLGWACIVLGALLVIDYKLG